MKLKRETQWLCDHAKTLERYSGQWVLFHPHQGLVGSGTSLQKAMRSAAPSTDKSSSFVFHVPSKKELSQPVLYTRKPR